MQAAGMTPAGFRAAVAALHWTLRGLAEILDCDDRLVRRWAAGEVPIPGVVSAWLNVLVAAHAALPPPKPEQWRTRSRHLAA